MTRPEQRMHWVLRRCIDPTHGGRGGIIAWDADTVDDFVAAFPEAEKALRVYRMRPNSSPMLNRAAKLAKDKNYLQPSVRGNSDRGWFNIRSWSRYWHLTQNGWDYLKRTEPKDIERYDRVYPGNADHV